MQKKITVALAIYRPNETWLSEQIQSLAAQENSTELELLCWNDSPEDFDADKWFEDHPQLFPVRVLSDGRNHGATEAFERLTQEAEGSYIAYCDQDDVWMPRKLEMMSSYMEDHPDCPCCHCDIEVVDSALHTMQQSVYPAAVAQLNVTDKQKKGLLRNNWTYGCAMLFRASVAKAALPFPRIVYHDKWLAIWAAFHGGIHFLSEPLVQHRLHSGHASQLLAGIDGRDLYYQMKLTKDDGFLNKIIQRIPSSADIYQMDVQWMKARKAWHKRHSIKNARNLWQLRRIRISITTFELLLPFLPNVLLSRLFTFLRWWKG